MPKDYFYFWSHLFKEYNFLVNIIILMSNIYRLYVNTMMMHTMCTQREVKSRTVCGGLRSGSGADFLKLPELEPEPSFDKVGAGSRKEKIYTYN